MDEQTQPEVEQSLRIERLGNGVRVQRIHTGMMFFFSAFEMHEIAVWIQEHDVELTALYNRQQQQKGGL